MRLAVVRHRVAVLSDRYRHLVSDRRDLERHRRARNKRHIQVRVVIRGLRDVDLLSVVADVRLGDRRRASVAELARIEQAVRAARRHGRCRGLLAAVVYLAVAAAVDRDRQRRLRDREDDLCGAGVGRGIALQGICIASVHNSRRDGRAVGAHIGPLHVLTIGRKRRVLSGCQRNIDRYASRSLGRGLGIADLIFNGIAFALLNAAVVGLRVRAAFNDHFQDRLPDGIEVVIGGRFIAGDLAHSGVGATELEGIVRLVVHQPQVRPIGRGRRRGTSRPSGPADEFIASVAERAGRLDVYRRVHVQIILGNLVARAVVGIPIDMGQGLLFDEFIHGHKLHRVGVAGVLRSAAFVLGDLSIGLQHFKAVAGKDRFAGTRKRSVLIFLDLPVGELILRRIAGRCGRGSDRFCQILVG